MSESKSSIRFCGEIAPGKNLVERRTGDDITTGVVSQMEDGKPLSPGAELVYVDHADTDGWHPATVLYKQGPAQVETPAYREGYDRIFGKKQTVGEA